MTMVTRHRCNDVINVCDYAGNDYYDNCKDYDNNYVYNGDCDGNMIIEDYHVDNGHYDYNDNTGLG